jgi:glycosyltransferase involved in cell wall biosynthesis
MRVRELSVFLPCYEEEGSVARTVERAVAVLRDRDLDRFEVIVVNDGSRDRTGAIADALAAEHDEVRVAHHVQNQGYGAALRTGFAESKFPWVFFTDGDGQFDLDEIDGFLAAADDVEVVIGYRLQRADHFGRRVNTWLWSLAVRTLFRLRVRDVDCAFKLLSRRALDQVGQLTASGAVISTELLVGVRRAGISAREIGVHHYPRQAGAPTGASMKVILRALRELAQLRLKTWRRASS